MSEYVLGRNVTVSILHDFGGGETYYPLFCAKSMELDIIIDELETALTTSGTDRHYESGLQSAVLTLVGVTKTKDPTDVTKASPFFLYSIRKEKKTYRITFTDQDAVAVTFTLDAVLRRLNFASNAISFNQSTAELRISGPLVTGDYGSGGGGGGCVPVSGSGFAPPDATIGTAYLYILTLVGSSPRTIGTTTIPSWMTAAIVSGNLRLTGTPAFGDIGSGIAVSVQVLNACGDQTFSDTINVIENGRNVFVINNSSVSIDITNDNGHVYTFGASNANDGNIKMQTDTVTLSLSGTKTYQFLTSLPSTIVNSGTSGSGTITTSNLPVTNYLRFSD